MSAPSSLSSISTETSQVIPAKKKGFLSKLRLPFFKKQDVIVRRHVRHDCCVIAHLRVIEREFEMDGVVLEISQGGVLFRPASTYIMDRQGERVLVRFEGRELIGTIMSSRPIGYGVKLDAPVDDETIEMVITKYGLRTIQAPH